MKILTWNLQGGIGNDLAKNNKLYELFGKGYDVICLQEATNKLPNFNTEKPGYPNIFEFRETSREQRVGSLTNSQSHYVCTLHKCGNSNTRCSLVTYMKKEHIINDYGVLNYSMGGNLRPMLWIKIKVGNYTWKIGNVHLPSGNQNLAFAVFEDFKNRMGCYKYAIVGDFNMRLSYLTTRYSANALNNFHNPGHSTQKSGGILDYVYYRGTALMLEASQGFYPSDHIYQTWELI
jgi:endonuclease/exonuclease/phosphatase family metal-dependent hydrolase